MRDGLAWSIALQASKRRPKHAKAFIEKSCGGDAELQETAEAMLALLTPEALGEFVEKSLYGAISSSLPRWDASEGRTPVKLEGNSCLWSFRKLNRGSPTDGKSARFVVAQNVGSAARLGSPYYEVMPSIDQRCIIVTHSNRRCGALTFLWHLRTATVFEFEALLFERDPAESAKQCLTRHLRRVFEEETPNNDWPT